IYERQRPRGQLRPAEGTTEAIAERSGLKSSRLSRMTVFHVPGAAAKVGFGQTREWRFTTPIGPTVRVLSVMCGRPRGSKGDLVCAPRSGAVMCPAYVARPYDRWP